MTLKSEIYRSIFWIGLLLLQISANGQSSNDVVGRISYMTRSGIYVKFDATSMLSIGDTLYKKAGQEYLPVLTVDKKSSISAICTQIGEHSLVIDNLVYYKVPVLVSVQTEEQVRQELSELNTDSLTTKSEEKKNQLPDKRKPPAIRGRIGASAHTNFTNSGEDYNQRMRYIFSLKSSDLGGSGFSSDIYMTYRHNTGPNTESSTSNATAYRIYNLSVSYDMHGKGVVSAGRKINRRIANVGAIDGLQYEAKAGIWTFGAVGGFRPRILDYGFDRSLFEYGGYISHTLRKDGKFSESSLAFFEQKNSGAIDRRFAYFQHSSSLANGLSAFVSFELDLYQLKEAAVVNKPRLSGFYSSVRYRFNRKVSIFASYDARNNIIYYETNKIRADELLDAATRQGLRMRVNLRPIKYMTVGVTAGYRFQKGNDNASRNLYLYTSYSRIPWLNASLSVTANLLETSFWKGSILGARMNKTLFKGKLGLGMHYRRVDYNFTSSDNVLLQDIGGLQINWRIIKPLSLSISYEGTLNGSELFNRVHANAVLRF